MAQSKLLTVLLVVLTALSMVAAQAPPPPPPSSGNSTCDPLTLRVCSSLLTGLLGGIFPGLGGGNTTSDAQCCSLLGLAGVDAGVCLCTALTTNVLGINLNVPLALRLLLGQCGSTAPAAGFNCPSA